MRACFLSFFKDFSWYGQSSKSQLNSLQYCSHFTSWPFGPEACRTPVPRPGTELHYPCTKRLSLNNWATRKVPAWGLSFCRSMSNISKSSGSQQCLCGLSSTENACWPYIPLLYFLVSVIAFREHAGWQIDSKVVDSGEIRIIDCGSQKGAPSGRGGSSSHSSSKPQGKQWDRLLSG